MDYKTTKQADKQPERASGMLQDTERTLCLASALLVNAWK